MKKKAIVFTIADDNNIAYARGLENSFKKFHPNIPFIIITGKELNTYIKDDSQFFYRATPVIGEKYIKDYELVLKIDSDSIITGSLDYVFDTDDYDIGTVINWNRVDPQTYGLINGWGILPIEYFNCGFVAMRSEKFIHHWRVLCASPQFERLRYKEQDLLNILCYYGNYNVRCFDHGDKLAKMSAWWGLIAKGEWNKAILKGNIIIIPKGDGKTPFPPHDMELKVIHFAGGKSGIKGNYRIIFTDDIIKRLDFLVK